MNWLWRALLVFANLVVCLAAGELPTWVIALWMSTLTGVAIGFEMMNEHLFRMWRLTLDKWQESIRQQERDPADLWKGED